MTRATLPGRFNRNGGEHVNTLMHRCTLLDEDVSYHPEDLRQGRDCKTPVPRFSALAGKPTSRLVLSPLQRSIAAAVGSMLAFAFLLLCAYLKGN